MANRLRFDADVPDGLSSEMQKLGFTDYEARIYIQLMRSSPATAYELSKVTGVPRANAYNALESLSRKEVVQPVSEDPVRYVAVPPQVMLERIASSTQKLCGRLATSLADLAKPEDSHYVWTLSGEDAVDERIKQMILEARHSVWIKAEASVLRKHDEELRQVAERNVDILIILFGEDPAEFRYSDRSQVYLHEANGMRIGTADNLFTLTVDHEQMLTANVEGEVFASYTRNQPIVTTAESLIRHDLYLAEIVRRFGTEIEGAFGPHLKWLRESCFTAQQLEAFKAKIGAN
ncbi:TrmB family transcriptional regulator [Marinobacterium aestuariivivens]|uniref:TrmB family transcriptional regulator n=1 Tax=Marinobacterium aestuariivivens TaxID=1698799 RepID=A0ABW2A9U3_9GAMM